MAVDYGFDCIECGETNDLTPAVVEFCVEVWKSCTECGRRQKINLRGEP